MNTPGRWVFEFDNDQATVLTAEGFVATLQVLLAEVALHDPVLINSTVRVHVTVMEGAERAVDDITVDDFAPDILVEAVLSDSVEDVAARDVAVIAQCFQLLHAVHARPTAELQDLLEPLFRNGLPHKVSVGRPYEETAALLDEDHYARCASIARPESSAGFTPVEREPLAPSTKLGTGYDADESLQAIRERYEVAFDTLRYTLPRNLADEDFRAKVVSLSEAGWLAGLADPSHSGQCEDELADAARRHASGSRRPASHGADGQGARDLGLTAGASRGLRL